MHFAIKTQNTLMNKRETKHSKQLDKSLKHERSFTFKKNCIEKKQWFMFNWRFNHLNTNEYENILLDCFISCIPIIYANKK